MTEARPKSSKKPEDKLAKALRDNLHRRKAQARARAKPSQDSPNPPKPTQNTDTK